MSSSNNSPNAVPPTSSPLLSSPIVSAKKHVTRAYSSKRAEVPDESPDADVSFGTLVDGDISISLSPAEHSRGTDDNVVSSQGTKVDDDDDGGEENKSPKQRKHKWSWETELKELSDSDQEGGSAPTIPISHHDGPSPLASRGRSAKSKGKRPPASPKKPQHTPLKTVRSESRVPGRAAAEPEASGSDADCSPPSPPKPKRRAPRRATDTAVIEDPDSDAPRASSSKSRGSRLNSADVDSNDLAPPGQTKRKRKTTTNRKPTAKVD